MYAAWPEAAGVCAADKHPLDYKVNCSAGAACVRTCHSYTCINPFHRHTQSVHTHVLVGHIPTSFSPVLLTCIHPSHHDIHCVHTLTPTHPPTHTQGAIRGHIRACAREFHPRNSHGRRGQISRDLRVGGQGSLSPNVPTNAPQGAGGVPIVKPIIVYLFPIIVNLFSMIVGLVYLSSANYLASTSRTFVTRSRASIASRPATRRRCCPRRR